MDSQERQLAKILQAAAELPAQEQDAYLAQSCADDPKLLAQARRRLEISSQPTEIFNLTDAVKAADRKAEAERQPEDRDLVGTTVGSIRLAEVLGQGGMGKVYLGHDEKLKRHVAVKGIRPEHTLSQELKARFLQEAQILSSLDHPNICRIYDYIEGGETDFLVLELIDGQSLDKVSSQQLSDDERMRYALQIADVLVAAHNQGIIHRDLKPANVMVDTQGEIKVLDFGLARSMGEEEMNSTITNIAETNTTAARAPAATEKPAASDNISGFNTQAGSLLGTLQYMSPEQAQGEKATPASDMFSYGLMIQEIFTGRPSYNPERGRPLIDVIEGRAEPVVGLGPELTGLIGRLKSAAPGARPSATDTAERLREIRDAPARRRNRRLKIAAFVGLAVVAVAMTVLSMLAYQQARIARQEAESNRQVLDFLVEIFEVSNPTQAKGEAITAREILDRGASRIATKLQGEPAIRATLLDRIGIIYQKIGLKEAARPLLEEALKTRRELFGEQHTTVAESLGHMSSLYLELARYEEADELSQKALTILEQAHGPAHEEVARILDQRGILLSQQGLYDESEKLLERAVAIRDQGVGSEPQDIATGLTNLASTYEYLSKFDQAEELHNRARTILEKMGPFQPELAASLNGLATFYDRQGKYAEALPLYARALAISEKVLAPDAPEIAVLMMHLAIVHSNLADHTKAESLYQRALLSFEQTLGPEHPQVGKVLGNLATMKSRQGKFAEAKTFFQRAHTIFASAFGPEHPAVAACVGGMGESHLKRRQYSAAATFFVRALSLFEEALGPEHPEVARTANYLASAYTGTGELEQAQALSERALSIGEMAFGPVHPDVGQYRVNLANILRKLGEYKRAEAELIRVRTTLEQKPEGNDPALAGVLLNLANVYRDRGDREEATPLYDLSQEILERARGPRDPFFVIIFEEYAALLQASGEGRRARELAQRARDLAAVYGIDSAP